MHPVISEVKVRMLVSAGVAFLLGAGIIAWPYLAHPHYHYHWLNNAGGGLLLLMGLSLIAGGRKVVLDENGCVSNTCTEKRCFIRTRRSCM